MSKSVTNGHALSVARDPSPHPDEIRRQLQQILASPVFHGSKRCQQFLEYVCENPLQAKTGRSKNALVAVEVFGRPPHIDLGEDTHRPGGSAGSPQAAGTVLHDPEGALSEIRIDLPSGSYAPEFRYVTVSPEGRSRRRPHRLYRRSSEAPPVRSNRKLIVWGSVGTVVAVAALVVVRLLAPGPNTEAFQRFWEPVFRSHEPLLIAMAHPIVYHPSGTRFETQRTKPAAAGCSDAAPDSGGAEGTEWLRPGAGVKPVRWFPET